MNLPEDVELVQTCFACPEQYDMLLFGVRVGYFRLRHSSYTVAAGGPSLDPQEVVLTEDYCPSGESDVGVFRWEDRDDALLRGAWAVLDRLVTKGQIR